MKNSFRYNHMCIPTARVMEGEKYWPTYDMYVSSCSDGEFGTQWMTCGEKWLLVKV